MVSLTALVSRGHSVCDGAGTYRKLCTTAHDACAIIDRMEPIVEIQLGGFAARFWRVAGIPPMGCATGLFSYCIAFKWVSNPVYLPS